ncbi:putative gene transfer agent orfg15 protein [Rhodobacteraceae bacterium KLH11]|nr:putative gene transfer agent orfg15 protein [Rhodobacteraceae bacterium KLH11]
MSASGAGDDISWIRRTRIDGDDWGGLEVPLGEESESYLIRVFSAGALLREAVVSGTNWQYSAVMQAEDGLTGPYDLAVAQVSATYGPGAFAHLAVV